MTERLGPKREDSRPVDVTELPNMRLERTVVSVPETLIVSEKNEYKPVADIVWHGDPGGNRYEQVRAIFDQAAARVGTRMRGNMPVGMAVEVRRFHALTPRTRYTAFGWHEIVFDIQINNARTGEIIVPRYTVDATFRGLSGQDAVRAENAGVTQKARILEQLEQRLFQELTGAPAADIDWHPEVAENEARVEGDAVLAPDALADSR